MTKVDMSLEETSSVLKLLSDRVRLSIVWMLHNNQCCVCELVEALEMSQPSTSQHLRKLRDAKVVKEDRRGKWIYYSLNNEAVFYPLVESVLEFVPDQKQLIKKMNAAQSNNLC